MAINFKLLINSFEERYETCVDLIQKMREKIEKGEHIKILETNKKLATYILNNFLNEKKTN